MFLTDEQKGQLKDILRSVIDKGEEKVTECKERVSEKKNDIENALEDIGGYDVKLMTFSEMMAHMKEQREAKGTCEEQAPTTEDACAGEPACKKDDIIIKHMSSWHEQYKNAFKNSDTYWKMYYKELRKFL